MTEPLPIEQVLPELMDALRQNGRAVLQAPPGAGKTTRVPLAMLEAGFSAGRIVMLEPRRLAARAAAERMAQSLGERIGETVGYRIRGENAIGRRTRIEVVTEGILTRMLQSEPDLPGVSTVIFDEFHERSLNADLGLALCLEVADALRDDLMLLVMSATLDAEPVAEMMQAPLVNSEGQRFPVETHWLSRPIGKDLRLESAVADLTLQALEEAQGSALVFLPGEGEIRRAEAILKAQAPDDVVVLPLFGALDFKAQRAAVAPATQGRKVVLATSIAETSLTIDGIGLVVDAGLSRRSEFDPSSGMSRLVTTRVSQAEARQRAGRAGRLSAGHCYKLWTCGEDGALPAFPPAEIEVGDLTNLALEMSLWGAQAEDLKFATPPNRGRLAEAYSVLQMLGAVDEGNRITAHGRELAALPLHPRLAHMVVKGGPSSPLLAALLSERDFLRGAPADISRRLHLLNSNLSHHNSEYSPHIPTVKRIREEAKRLKKFCSDTGPNEPSMLAAMAYPDRIGKRRKGDTPRFLLSGGKGAVLSSAETLATTRFLVATDLDGDPREARIRQAISFSEQELRELFADQIVERRTCAWSQREGRVRARFQTVFGALVLDDRIWKDAPEEDVAHAMLDGVRKLGLFPTAKARRLMARAALMRQSQNEFPDLREATLLGCLEDWLLPFIVGLKTADDWGKFDITPALENLIGWNGLQHLQAAVPEHFVTPLGRKIPIEYEDMIPKISVRLQEMFGVIRHPTAAGTPLRVTLLSPAQRPVQVTEDLPGFWKSSYSDVRKDMRGRYPKHPWPEDPTQADPTLRTKRKL